MYSLEIIHFTLSRRVGGECSAEKTPSHGHLYGGGGGSSMGLCITLPGHRATTPQSG